MADYLFFSRDTSLFMEFGGVVWKLPVLDGYSFSQATNAVEITLNEMEASTGGSRRGRRAFNNSLAPADWSFQTYARPFKAAGAALGGGSADTNAYIHAIEEALWAAMAGADTYASAVFKRGTNTVHGTPSADINEFDFGQSNFSTLGTFNLYFVVGDRGTRNTLGFRVYKLEGCTVNEATVDFEIDGIATISWSGNANNITDHTTNTIVDSSAPASSGAQTNKFAGVSAGTTKNLAVGDVFIDNDNGDQLQVCTAVNGTPTFTPFVNEKTTTVDSGSFIRNRLTQLAITVANQDPDGDGVDELQATYDLTLTGGSITITNNNTYITPEELGVVNNAIGHVTGTRTVGGNFTCYLTDTSSDTNASQDFFNDMKKITNVVTNSFGLKFRIGGNTANTPRLQFDLGTCHVEIPTHSIEDVISLDTTFSALPSTIGGTDEVKIGYAVDTAFTLNSISAPYFPLIII